MAHQLHGPEVGEEGPRDARSSRLMIDLVSREASFDAPLTKQRDEVVKSVGLSRASDLEASGYELAIIPSESFLDKIHSDDPLGSDSEGLG